MLDNETDKYDYIRCSLMGFSKKFKCIINIIIIIIIIIIKTMQ